MVNSHIIKMLFYQLYKTKGIFFSKKTYLLSFFFKKKGLLLSNQYFVLIIKVLLKFNIIKKENINSNLVKFIRYLSR
jgi:hypothetical protein